MQKILSGYCHIANISDQNTTSAKRINQGVQPGSSTSRSDVIRDNIRINQGSTKDQSGVKKGSTRDSDVNSRST